MKSIARLLNYFSYKDNVIKTFLYILGIPFTNNSFDKIYKFNPTKDNLFGVKNILAIFGLKTIGLKLSEKEELFKIDVPCIVKLSGDFVVYLSSSDSTVSCILNKEKINFDKESFLSSFEPYVLIPEEINEGVDSNWIQNVIIDIYSYLFKNFSVIFFISVSIIAAFNSNSISIIHIFLNVLGFIACYYLSMQKRIAHSNIVSRICGLIKNGNCNSVLSSASSKLFNRFNLTVLGETYFLSNLILLSFNVDYIYVYAILNLLSLPITFWSIWTQYRKIGSWCIFCLIVMADLWCIFATNIVQCNLLLYSFTQFIIGIVVMICIFMVLDYCDMEYEHEQTVGQEKFKRNSILNQKDYFSNSLIKERYYNVTELDSSIIFGNRKSKNKVTIVLNPHCSPCAEVYKDIERILDYCGSRIMVQLVFLPFSVQFEPHNLLLISFYFRNSEEETRKLYKEWFSYGRNNYKEYSKKYDLESFTPKELAENNKHLHWREKNDIRVTPFILINGYALPEKFELGDLLYMF